MSYFIIIIIVLTISAVSTLSLGIGHQANKPKPLCVTMSTGINGTSDGRDDSDDVAHIMIPYRTSGRLFLHLPTCRRGGRYLPVVPKSNANVYPSVSP
jgi:hypothetical protein